MKILFMTALFTAVIHTITGPDHYLPFIAIAKTRNFSLRKTLMWTFICGIGHILSALAISLIFIYFSHLLTNTQFAWIEENRSNVAAFTLIGLGFAYIVWSLRHRWLHKHNKAHHHGMLKHGDDTINGNGISVWVLFIIFVLGPCEALFPILTASSIMGTFAIITSTLIFSIATISTMLFATCLGYLGITSLHFKKIEKYAHELAGMTIMGCGVLILIGL